jgi:hypothetical protein
MKIRGAVPRAGMLALVAVLALSVTAFTSCGRSTTARGKLSQDGSVSYPATYAAPLEAGSPQVVALDAALSASSIGRTLARFSATGADSSTRTFINKPHRWSVVGLPVAIARQIAGAQVYVLRGFGSRPAGSRYIIIHEFLAAKDGRLYGLPDDLSQLLADCGLRFHREDVMAWTRVAVYVATASTRYRNSWTGGEYYSHAVWDSISRGQAPLTPPMTLGKVGMDTAKTIAFGQSLDPGDIQEVRIETHVPGETDTVFIETTRAADGLFPVGLFWSVGGAERGREFVVPRLSMLGED